MLLTWITLFVFALTTGMDGLILGWTYGLQKLPVYRMTYVSVGMCSGISFGLFVLAGETWFDHWFTPDWTVRIGASILMGMGILSFRSSGSQTEEHVDETAVPSLLKRLLQGLQMGCLLSIDSAASGTAASLLNFPIFAAIVVMACCSACMLAIGVFLGSKGVFNYTAKYAGRTAGIVLFIFGCSKWMYH